MFTRNNAIAAVSKLNGVVARDLEVASGTLDSGHLHVRRQTARGPEDDADRGWHVFKCVESAVEAHARDLEAVLSGSCITSANLGGSKYFEVRELCEALVASADLSGLREWVSVRCRFKLSDLIEYQSEGGQVDYRRALRELCEVPESEGDAHYLRAYEVVWHQCRCDYLAATRRLMARNDRGLIREYDYLTRGLGYALHFTDDGLFVMTRER